MSLTFLHTGGLTLESAVSTDWKGQGKLGSVTSSHLVDLDLVASEAGVEGRQCTDGTASTDNHLHDGPRSDGCIRELESGADNQESDKTFRASFFLCRGQRVWRYRNRTLGGAELSFCIRRQGPRPSALDVVLNLCLFVIGSPMMSLSPKTVLRRGYRPM